MELILIRHALAEDRDLFALKNRPDHLRPLLPKGRQKIQKVAQHLQKFFSEIDCVVSSPYTRARQSAEIISQIYFDSPVLESSELVPQAHPLAFLKWLRVHAQKQKKIIVVGHEPQLSTFACFLLAEKTESFISLKKAGIIFLEVESLGSLQPGGAVLKGLLSPKIFLTSTK